MTINDAMTVGRPIDIEKKTHTKKQTTNKIPIKVKSIEFLDFMIIFISSKFIVPRDKYINENPKSNNPDAKDPKTKYFIPA